MSERTLEKCNREEGKRDLCAEIRNCRRRTASLNKGRDNPLSKVDFRTDGRDHKIVDAFSVRRSRPTVFRNGFPHGWSPSQNCGRALRTEKPANHFQKWISARMVAITKLWTRSPYGEAGQPFSEMDFHADGRDHKIEGAFSVRRRRSSVQKRPFCRWHSKRVPKWRNTWSHK